MKMSKAAKKLKNNKSLFSDKIRIEMIKASIDTLMPVYSVTSSILSLGTMPWIWCDGLITPFIKRADEVIRQTIVVFVSLAAWENCFVLS